MLKKLQTPLKIIVTVVGLYLAFSSSDLSEVDLTFTSYQLLLFIFVFVLNILNVFLISIRLKSLIPSVPLKISTKVTFIGIFFNMFLPSIVGGDIARMYELNKFTKNNKSSIGLILLDRVIGLSSLSLLALLFVVIVIFMQDYLLGDLLVYLSFGISIVLGVFWLFFIIHKFNNGTLFTKVAKYFPEKFQEKLDLFSTTLMEVSWLQITKAFFWGILFHLNSGFLFYVVISKIYDMDISFLASSIINAITNLILVLPISIGGLGVRDYLYTVFVPEISSNSELVLVGPTIYLVIFLTGLIGGVIYVTGSRIKSNEELKTTNT